MIATSEHLAETMKQNIRDLISAGVVPRGISDFGKLHSFCDANVLVENEDLYNAMISESAGDDEHQRKFDAFMAIAGPAQDIVHVWLQQGMP